MNDTSKQWWRIDDGDDNDDAYNGKNAEKMTDRPTENHRDSGADGSQDGREKSIKMQTIDFHNDLLIFSFIV